MSRKNLTRTIILLFNKSEVALLAASQKILNASAFARIIQPQVEKIVAQKVSVKIISTILLRYLKAQQLKLAFPTVFVKEIQELGSKHKLSMIKVKFSRSHPNQYYVILARLAIYQITVVKLSISSGVLTMLVDQEQSGLTLMALRSLLKKKRQFNSH